MLRCVIAGTQKESNLSALEKSYYSACIKYLSGEDVTAEDWAAYKSRISAVGVLVDGNYKPLQRQYLEESDGEVPNILASLKKMRLFSCYGESSLWTILIHLIQDGMRREDRN